MIGRRRGKAGPDPRQAASLASSWQLISLLLDYPSEDLIQRLPRLRPVLDRLPGDVRRPLARLFDHLESTEPMDLQVSYVETFDTTRRCCLYLTYFAYGDTRKRGVALVRFKQAYRGCGVELAAEELPDHLCVVLEFGASQDLDVAWKLLNEYRAGLEVLRISLQDRESPWADAMVALSATLPPLAGDDAQALNRLISQGPPQEEVGVDLTPYAIDPMLAPHPPRPVALGDRIPIGGPA